MIKQKHRARSQIVLSENEDHTSSCISTKTRRHNEKLAKSRIYTGITVDTRLHLEELSLHWDSYITRISDTTLAAHEIVHTDSNVLMQMQLQCRCACDDKAETRKHQQLRESYCTVISCSRDTVINKNPFLFLPVVDSFMCWWKDWAWFRILR